MASTHTEPGVSRSWRRSQFSRVKGFPAPGASTVMADRIRLARRSAVISMVAAAFGTRRPPDKHAGLGQGRGCSLHPFARVFDISAGQRRAGPRRRARGTSSIAAKETRCPNRRATSTAPLSAALQGPGPRRLRGPATQDGPMSSNSAAPERGCSQVADELKPGSRPGPGH